MEIRRRRTGFILFSINLSVRENICNPGIADADGVQSRHRARPRVI